MSLNTQILLSVAIMINLTYSLIMILLIATIASPNLRSQAAIAQSPSFACDVGFVHFAKAPWQFDFGIVNGQGLVVKNVIAGKELLFNSVSVPHFEIKSASGQSKIIRFCDSNGVNKPFPNPKIVAISAGNDAIQWNFIKDFHEKGLDGVLTISYDVLVRSGPVHNCEPSHSECFRFIPKISYKWTDANILAPNLGQFKAFYKLDYEDKTGLADVSDGNSLPSAAFISHGVMPYQLVETKFRAVTDGREGSFDNLHTGHARQTIEIPGCRESQQFFDCVHIHWRWSSIGTLQPFVSVDPMVEPSTDQPIAEGLRGTPYLVPGQTIDIAVVKFNPGEDNPDDPFTLVNDEKIAVETGLPGSPHSLLDAFHPVVWYVASVNNADTATFFRHGLFVENTSGKPTPPCPSPTPNTITASVNNQVNNCTLPTPPSPKPQPQPQQQCDPNSPLILFGSTGPKVEELQQDLTQLGHSVGPHGIDGIFGPDTRAAVIQFQQEHGLGVDGKVGPQTWGAICS
jgi:hypothetical protein